MTTVIDPNPEIHVVNAKKTLQLLLANVQSMPHLQQTMVCSMLLEAQPLINYQCLWQLLFLSIGQRDQYYDGTIMDY